jgi:hypothetical protein
VVRLEALFNQQVLPPLRVAAEQPLIAHLHRRACPVSWVVLLEIKLLLPLLLLEPDLIAGQQLVLAVVLATLPPVALQVVEPWVCQVETTGR